MNHACDTPAFRIASDTELLTLDAVHSVVRLKRVARATLTALRRTALARALAARLPVASLTDGAAAVRRAAARCGVILARITACIQSEKTAEGHERRKQQTHKPWTRRREM